MNKTKHIRQKALQFLREFAFYTPSLEDLLTVLKKQGFDIIEYSLYDNTEAVEKLITALNLEKNILTGKALVYKSGDIKLIFVCEDLSADEKLYALSHEEGHIYCNHLQEGNVSYSVEEEREANEFAHYVLHPTLPQQIVAFVKNYKKISVAICCLIFVAIITIAGIVHTLVSTFTKDVHYGDKHYVQSSSSEPYQIEDYYVTLSGTKYHAKNCRYIKGRDTKVLPQDKAKNSKYQPCKVCLPNE